MYTTENLYFQGTGFAGTIPRLPSGLVELDASFTLLAGKLDGASFAGLENLSWMLLDGNAYNSSVPVELGSLPNLKFLYVADAFVTGDLSYMQGMPSIVEHWIDINPGLSGPVFSFIGELSTLGSFSVSQNSLTGTLPPELGNIADMQQMWFYDNNIGGQIPSELGLLNSLNTLQLEGNDFTGSMPVEVCAQVGFLRPLEFLGGDCDDPNFEVSKP